MSIVPGAELRPRNLPKGKTMWEPLTEDVLNQVLNAGELASVTRDRAQVQPDPIPGILAETAATIRSRIASGGRTKLQGGPDCIPGELMAEAGAIVRYRVLVRFALAMTEERVGEWKHANEVLRELSSGSYVIADDASGKTPSPHYSGRPPRWGMSRHGGVM